MAFVIVRYSEIGLKGGRRKWFEDRLEENIKKSLGDVLKRIKRYYGRIVLEVSDETVAKIKLSKIFGIKSFSFAERIEFNNLNDLTEKAFEYFKDKVKGKTFKVECNRVGKHDFNSYDVKVVLGDKLSSVAKVDVKNPDVECWIEIRNKEAYLFTQFLNGPGGLPIGTEGKVLALVSGGYDSIVAAWFLMKRGCKVDFVFFNQGSDLQKYFVLRTIKKLLEWSVGYENTIYVVDFLDISMKILKEVKPSLSLIVFRRSMYSLAEKIALGNGHLALVTGESIGQKSSQTAENLYSAEYGIRIPIFRPLIGLDKDEIINISRYVGTYEYSEKVPELCSLLSVHPSVKSNAAEVIREFKKIEPLLENVSIEKITFDTLDDYLRKISYIEKEFTRSLSNFDESGRIKIFIGKRKIPGVISLDFSKAYDFVKSHGKENKYLLICERGISAYVLANKLKKEGYDVKYTSIEKFILHKE